MKKLVSFVSAILLISLAGCTQPAPAGKTASNQKVARRHVNGSQPITVHRVIIDIPEGQIIGRHHLGKPGQMPLIYAWKEAGVIIDPGVFVMSGTAELRESGFDAPGWDSGFDSSGKQDPLFGQDNADKARYQLGATINDIAYDTYDDIGGFYSESTVRVNWELQDTVSRQIVFTYTNSGYAKQPRLDNSVIPLAFRDALKNMVAASTLVDLVATNGSSYSAATGHAETAGVERAVNIAVPHYDPPRSLPEDMDKMTQGVVYIQSGKPPGVGVIISPDGYVLTAAHLVSGKAQVNIRFNAGLHLNALVLREDREYDIAILKLPGTGYPAVELNLAAPGPVGDELYAIGPPANDDLSFSITKGVISAYRLREGDKAQFIQTDAALVPGNSGGLMLDKSGRVIGIVSRKINLPGYEGLDFGVPLDVIARRLGVVWVESK